MINHQNPQSIYSASRLFEPYTTALKLDRLLRCIQVDDEVRQQLNRTSRQLSIQISQALAATSQEIRLQHFHQSIHTLDECRVLARLSVDRFSEVFEMMARLEFSIKKAIIDSEI